MSYAEAEAEAEAEASLSRSDSVAGFGVFVMFFPRFDDRIPALPRPPPQSLHSTAAAATSTHVLDIFVLCGSIRCVEFLRFIYLGFAMGPERF